MRLRAGPFELEDVLGRGGQGEVWRGHHTHQKVAVAIKLLTQEHARDARRLRTFQNEVRSVAALDHENIVWVYDHGIFGPRAREDSRGRIAAGTPWLAMELARSGSLASRLGVMTWPEIESVLRDVLAGLAHAHARGVLHRDLKPENVLMEGGRAKLSDFGLGLSLRTDARDAALRAGTPAYMAPEQFAGGELGPWTDLYALGCLAFALVTGGPPFPESGYALQRALHASRSLPPLRPRVAVPPHLESWCQNLTARNLCERYAHAADAATDFRELGEARPPAAWHERPPSAYRRRTPQPPASCGGSGEVARSIELVDAGLGLFGLRAVPLIGRDRARDQLWSALLAVVHAGSPRAVVIEGPAGSGKSHLARWLGERAQELGVAKLVRASCEAGPTRELAIFVTLRDELDRMVGRAKAARTGAAGQASAPGDDEQRRLRDELRRPGAVEGPAERDTLAQRMLIELARDRPLVVWLDDIHESREAAALVVRVMASAPKLPVLFVMTSREASVATLAELSGVERVELAALGVDHLGILVRRLLPLHPVLVARVVERSGGSPLFAVQLVGNWVDRGVVTPSPAGYVLVAAADTELPNSIYDVWSARLDRFLAGRAPADRDVLELAAALGQEVDSRELDELAAGGNAIAVVDAFVGAGLALRFSESRWSFAHGLLRETILTRARRADRVEIHHQRCAAMLRAHAGEPGRIGRHELSGGRPEAAVWPLLEGARRAIVLADSGAAVLLLDDAARAVREAGLLASDTRRGWLEIRGAQTMRMRVRHADGGVHIGRALAAAEQHGWLEIRAEALVARAALSVLSREGDPAPLLVEALAAADGHGSPHLRVLVRNLLGNDAFWKRELATADRWFREAIVIAEVAGDEYSARPCWLGLCHVALVQGDLRTARAHCERSLACAERIGSRSGRAYALMTLGELARLEGDLAAAELLYRDGLALYTFIDHAEAVTAELNLGTTLLQQGKVAAATGHYRRALASAHRFERPLWVGAAHVCLLAAAASESDDAGWMVHATQVRKVLAPGKTLDGDFVRLLRLAATRAEAAGYPQRVVEAEALIASAGVVDSPR